MSTPKLPRRPEDTWDAGFVLDPAQPVHDVSGAGGLIFAGGDALLMLRPGAEGWKTRPAPEGLGAILAVAAEPGPPWRYAVASERAISLFGLPGDQSITLSGTSDAPRVTHLVWACFGKEKLLHVRWVDGSVGRVRVDLGMIEELAVMPMDAIAADANGVLGMVAVRCDPGEAHAVFTADGERFEERPAVAVPGGDAPVHVAVAGAAIAYAVEGAGVRLSRGVDDDFDPCEGLASGGPLAFQGSDPDAALFGAVWSRSVCAIDRVDGGGAVQRIAELEATAGEAPKLSALLWDRSRRALWAASPQAGLLRSDEPALKGSKKPRAN